MSRPRAVPEPNPHLFNRLHSFCGKPNSLFEKLGFSEISAPPKKTNSLGLASNTTLGKKKNQIAPSLGKSPSQKAVQEIVFFSQPGNFILNSLTVLREASNGAEGGVRKGENC